MPHFGHAKVYETSIWTPCFQISAKTLHGGGGGVERSPIKKSWREGVKMKKLGVYMKKKSLGGV